MDLQLQGKIALVTGGSRGIGFAIAQGLVKEGVKVVVSARNQAHLETAISKLCKEGRASGITADVTKPEEIDALMEYAQAHFGAPDILVSNAGGPPSGRVVDIDDNGWAEGYELTLMANIRLARAALPNMQVNRWGRIINITSISVKQPLTNIAISNTFRAAVTGFAKTLSTEVAAAGVTINNVAPGYTDTQRLKELFSSESIRNALIQEVPAKRFATPEEVAAAAIFLASKQAAYITGQTIVVDGGVVSATY